MATIRLGAAVRSNAPAAPTECGPIAKLPGWKFL